MSVSTYTPDSTKILHTAYADFVSRQIGRTVHVVQYDDGLPLLAVKLFSNGQPYTIPSNADISIKLEKSDGKFVYNPALGCDLSRNTAYFEITYQMVVLAETVSPVIEVKIGSSVAATSSIGIIIDKNPIQREDIESTSEWKVIQQAIEYTRDAVNYAASASASRSAAAVSETNAKTSEVNAKNSENDAKSYANRASNSANSSAASATAASNAASNASASAIAADISANNAKISETKAKTSETNAKTAETNAKTSETNAKSSETKAKTSEANAKDFESNTKESAHNAYINGLLAKSYAVGDTFTALDNDVNEIVNRENENTDNARYYAEQSRASADSIIGYEEASDRYAQMSRSYAIGDTDSRPNEVTDNAKYYYQQTRQISENIDGALLPMGTVTFENLANQTKTKGYTYNISDDFVSDRTFKDGGGIKYPRGTNVYWTSDGYWDCLSGSTVACFTSTTNEAYYAFASLPVPSVVGGGCSQFSAIVSGAGNFGDNTFGTHLVVCSTRNAVKMQVIQLSEPYGEIEFGYWEDGDEVYFGMKGTHWSYPVYVTGLSGKDPQNLYHNETQPAGWTKVDVTQYLPLTDGTLGNIVVKAEPEPYVEAEVRMSRGDREGLLVMSANGRFGLYDDTYGKWVVVSDEHRNVFLYGDASRADGLQSFRTDMSPYNRGEYVIRSVFDPDGKFYLKCFNDNSDQSSYRVAVNYADNADRADSAQYLGTFGHDGLSHGKAHLLKCQHDLFGDGKFGLGVEGFEIEVDWAKSAIRADSAQYLETFSSAGGPHGKAHLLKCQHDLFGDGKFGLGVDGFDIEVDWAKSAMRDGLGRIISAAYMPKSGGTFTGEVEQKSYTVYPYSGGIALTCDDSISEADPIHLPNTASGYGGHKLYDGLICSDNIDRGCIDYIARGGNYVSHTFTTLNSNGTPRGTVIIYDGKISAPNGFHTSYGDYAEYWEYADANQNNEDRTGLFVTFTGNKIRISQSGDNLAKVGVVSATPSIVGDSDGKEWKYKYQQDIYGREIWKDTEQEDGTVIQERVLNPKYDETQKYVKRADRPEWDAVGTHGKLVVRDDGTCEPDSFCVPTDGGIATMAEDGFYVMERLDENHIRIYMR